MKSLLERENMKLITRRNEISRLSARKRPPIVWNYANTGNDRGNCYVSSSTRGENGGHRNPRRDLAVALRWIGEIAFPLCVICIRDVFQLYRPFSFTRGPPFAEPEVTLHPRKNILHFIRRPLAFTATGNLSVSPPWPTAFFPSETLMSTDRN